MIIINNFLFPWIGQGQFILTNIKALHSSPRLVFFFCKLGGNWPSGFPDENVKSKSTLETTIMMIDAQILIRKALLCLPLRWVIKWKLHYSYWWRWTNWVFLKGPGHDLRSKFKIVFVYDG